jgi:5-formyltetrahydrofolate cyclo-ligase
MDKRELRTKYIAKRQTIPTEVKQEKSRQILEKIVELPEYQKAENILAYASRKGEVITDEIILDALSLGKNVFCPKVTDVERSQMEFVRINSLEEMSEGAFGIREPQMNESSDVAKELDPENTLVIMPGAVFDRQLNRIGYGAGFYDRYLKKYPFYRTVALCFACQIADEVIEADVNDVKPGMLITEDELIR